MDELRVTYTVTEDDFRSAVNVGEGPDGQMPPVRLALFWLAAILVGSLLIAAFVGGVIGSIASALSIALMGAVAVFAWIQRAQFKAAAAASGPSTLSLTDAGLSLESDATALTIKWSSLTTFDDRPDHFVLKYNQDRVFMVVPKRAFDSDTQAARFRDLVLSRTPTVNALEDLHEPSVV